MELINEINNNIEIEKNQNKFFDTMIGKTINNAIDIGLKAILPDLVENQIIEIKNALLENGIKEGIKTASNAITDFAKSALGIITGKFEDMSQVNIAVQNGGIIDTISNILDTTINKVYEKGYINQTINTIIKTGKNTILKNVENNIRNELKNQTNNIEKLEQYVVSWKKSYSNKDFEGMTKEYNKIQSQMKNIIPLENLLKETRKIETLHNLIKNNGNNFDITETEKELVDKLT